jgi:hypothetical protein
MSNMFGTLVREEGREFMQYFKGQRGGHFDFELRQDV